MFGETVASSLTGVKPHSSKKETPTQGKGEAQPGIVTIVDMQNVGEGQVIYLYFCFLQEVEIDSLFKLKMLTN